MKIKSVLSDPEKDRLENLESYVEVFQFNRPNPLNFPITS